MISTGLAKFAKEQGLKVDAGVAYGLLGGYAATMQDGANIKQITFTTCFRELSQMDSLREAVDQQNFSKEYRVQELTVFSNGVNIVFSDTVGTMKRIKAFVERFLPMLEEYGAQKGNICPECGAQIHDGGQWVLRDGTVAFHVHSACARKMQEEAASENQQRLEEDKGSYLTGAIGAFLGAILGAVVWAVVLMLGYVAGLVGLLIGFLANKGYNLLHGKQGKIKIAILILAILVGVVAGTFGGAWMSQMQYLEDYGMQWYELPGLIVDAMDFDPDFRAGMLSNFGVGLLFAALGTFGLLAREGKTVSGSKIKLLK